jgi:hypothetical protein
LLDRDIARLLPAEDLVYIVAGAPEQVRHVRSIGDQTACFDEIAVNVNRRQPSAHSQDVDADSMGR